MRIIVTQADGARRYIDDVGGYAVRDGFLVVLVGDDRILYHRVVDIKSFKVVQKNIFLDLENETYIPEVKCA